MGGRKDSRESSSLTGRAAEGLAWPLTLFPAGRRACSLQWNSAQSSESPAESALHSRGIWEGRTEEESSAAQLECGLGWPLA